MEIILFRGIICVVLFAACALRYFTSDDTTSLLHDIQYCTQHGVGDITKDKVADKTTVKNTGSDQWDGMCYLTTEQRDVSLDGIKQSVSISTTIESNVSLLRTRLTSIHNLPATTSIRPLITKGTTSNSAYQRDHGSSETTGLYQITWEKQ